MKIGLVTFGVTGRGGTQRQFLSLAKELKRVGHDVAIYTLDFIPEQSYDELLDGLRVVVAENLREDPLYLHSKPAVMGLLGKTVAKLRRKSFTAEASRRLAEKIDTDTEVVNTHDADSYKVGYFFKKINPAAKIVWTMNDPPISYLPKNNFLEEVLRRIFNFFDLTYEKRFIKAVDRIVVLDERNRKMAENFYQRPADIARSGLEFEKFYAPVKQRNFRDRPAKLLGLATLLSPHRRFEDIIRATDILRKKRRSISVTLLNRGSSMSAQALELKALIKSLDLEEIIDFIFTEAGISDVELKRAYAEHDIFIFPNHMQTWGLSVFEAMAAGLAVVVSRTSGASDVLVDGKTAFLVDPLRPDQIADKVEILIDSPGLYKTIAENGQKFVKENISWEKYASSMLDIFRD